MTATDIGAGVGDKNIIQVKIGVSAGDFDDEGIDHVFQVETGARTRVGEQVGKINGNPAPAANGEIARLPAPPAPGPGSHCRSSRSGRPRPRGC